MTGTVAYCVGDMQARFRFPYDPEAVDMVKLLPRARFDGAPVNGSWTVSPYDAATVQAVIDGAKRITEFLRAKIDARDTKKKDENAEKSVRGARRATVKVGAVAVGDLARGTHGVILVTDLGAMFERRGDMMQYAYGDLITDEASIAGFVRRDFGADTPAPIGRSLVRVAAGSLACGDAMRLSDGRIAVVSRLRDPYLVEGRHCSAHPMALWDKEAQLATLRVATAEEAAAFEVREAEAKFAAVDSD